MTTLEYLGEFDLIARIKSRSSRLYTPEVVLGIGDDAAVLRPRRGEDLVVSTDTLVEEVHFRWDNQAAATIGRRALLVNLSDLAAMGARPVGFTLALCAPSTLQLSHVDGLLSGLLKEAGAYGCPLVGGNLSRAEKTSMAVTILGAVPRGKALRRDRARAGDSIYVTGTLGGAGLALQKSQLRGGVMRHLPTARLDAGRTLAGMKNVGACIDLSDGFASDLEHVLDASGVGAEIDVARIPTPKGFVSHCAALDLAPEDVAVRSGEDYELLFTLRGAKPKDSTKRPMHDAQLSKQLGLPVTKVGRIVKEPGVQGLAAVDSEPGYRHF